MDSVKNKLENYYGKEQPFRDALQKLREIALTTDAEEAFKWGSPVYTVNGKNVFGIMGFKHHFGIWFFNGVFLSDTAHVLEIAQENTKAMRHWKFCSAEEIDPKLVLAYMKEAIANQKKGLELKPERKKAVEIPPLLKDALKSEKGLQKAFDSLTPGKQREFCEYIASCKQEKTKQSRLEKSLSLIRSGVSLHDKYR